MRITNLADQPVRSVSKPVHRRMKLTRRQRSELTPKEDKRLKERSGHVCEACRSQRATERAHCERRWKSEGRPTAEDFLHMCVYCHDWCDSCKEGRQYLLDQRERLMSGEKPQSINEWRMNNEN